MFGPVPSTPSFKPELALALADRQFVYDGSPAWSPERAARTAAGKGITAAEVAAVASKLEQSQKPAPRGWIIDRLTVLATLYSVGRHAPAAADLTVWLSESARLLADVPHDILATAIDRAIVTRTHGFMPSIGEIMTVAEPMVEERGIQLRRLAFLQGALEQDQSNG